MTDREAHRARCTCQLNAGRPRRASQLSVAGHDDVAEQRVAHAAAIERAEERQHIEGLTRVTIDGDTAQSLSFYFHTHEAREVKANLIDTGYWHDDWVRTPKGWRIKKRRHQPLYTNTYAVIQGPDVLGRNI